MLYVVFKPDGTESKFSLSYSQLREQYDLFVAMSDAEFMTRLADAAHLACIIAYLKELGPEATFGDAGIIHELIHLMTIPVAEYGMALPQIREQFQKVLALA